MKFFKKPVVTAILIALMPYCFCMQKGEAPQKLLVDAIKNDQSTIVFNLIKQDKNNILWDVDFIKNSIVPFLSSKNSRIRGLASLFLFKKVSDGKTILPSFVFSRWKAAALNYKLKDVSRIDSMLCAASIRVMGDHSFGKEEDEAYGAALAIAKPWVVSIPVQRKDLEEFYVVISGVGEVWLKDIKTDEEKVITLQPGVTVKIPSASIVQYRNTGEKNLILFVPTNPPYGVIGKRTNWQIEKQFENGKWPWKKS
jgi:mannose-6-phosphate isomerase-like protein (cupin superfamily)